MLRALLLFCFCLGFLTPTGPASAQTPLTALPLGDASAFDDAPHIIVTAELEDGVDAPDFAAALAARFDISVVAVWPLASIDVTCFVFRADADAEAVTNALSAVAGVQEAYQVNPFQTLVEAAYPDDLFSIQDGLRQMRVPEVHTSTRGAGVKVALIDTGVATSHRDLAARLITQRDFVSRAATAETGERHGTAMAAIIAADADNMRGMIGVSPDVDLLALRACWEETGGRGVCNTFSLARALNFAILNDAEVINLSLAGPRDPILRALIAAALRRGIAVVAAYPDDGGSALVRELPGVILAGSSAGGGGHVIAPGVEVLSAKPADDFDFFSGVSVSAAHVAGAAALARATRPDLSIGQLTAAMSIASDYGRTPIDMCALFANIGETPPACR